MDWWLNHGLDGIVGGVVAGLATALAVWLTLRHERRLTRENAAIDTAAKTFPLILHYSQILGTDPTGRSVAEIDRDLHANIWELLARSERAWPNFKASLTKLDQDLLRSRQLLLDSPAAGREEGCANVKRCIDDVFTLTANWVKDPEQLERSVRSQL